MSTRLKTSLLLSCTLVLGMMIGAFLSNIYINHKQDVMRKSMRRPDWFAEQFEKIVEPTEEQQAAIRDVFQKHRDRVMKYQREFPMHMDTLKQELNAILTEEQLKKLNEHEKLFRDRKPFDREHGPDKFMGQGGPPGGPERGPGPMPPPPMGDGMPPLGPPPN